MNDNLTCYLCQSVFDARNEGELINDRFICRTCTNNYDDEEIDRSDKVFKDHIAFETPKS